MFTIKPKADSIAIDSIVRQSLICTIDECGKELMVKDFQCLI